MRPPCQPVAKCFCFQLDLDPESEPVLVAAQINDVLTANDVRAIYDTVILEPGPGLAPGMGAWLFVFGRSYVPCDDLPPPE